VTPPALELADPEEADRRPRRRPAPRAAADRADLPRPRDGVTTTADYIFAASVIGPALVSLGLTLLVANLYIFCWASSSALTPPVAAAVFVTAGIAGAEVTRTGIIACRLALAAGIGGYFARPASHVDRTLLLAAGALLVVPGLVTDVVGGGLLLGVWAKQRFLEPARVRTS
jgi:TRAP-type uncharacterized transport system fused permease subunit